MNTIESSQQIEPSRGGAAPPDRQCHYTFASGYHCRRWAIRGHEYCHEHGRFQETRVDGPIEVPLMEDPSAVQLVVTQTTRALGWGQIPPANGRGILYGCRIVQNGFALQLAEAKFRLKCHQLGLNPDQFLSPHASAGAPCKPGVPIALARMGPSVGLSGNPPDALGAAQPGSPASELDGGERRHDAVKQRHDGRSPGLQPGEKGATVQGASAPAGCPLSPAAGDMGERDSAPDLSGQEESVGAPFKPSVGLSGSLDSDSSELNLDAAIGPPNPLDDLPPSPRPQSLCDPCVAAIAQGADESLLDCKNCPAHRSGNLRPPQLPDPRNPPETRHDSGCPTAWPERSGGATQSNGSPAFGEVGKPPAFRNLKTKWDRAIHRFSDQCAGPRFPVHHPLKTDTEYAAELAEMRARPFADVLRPAPTSPPPPIPQQPNRSSTGQ